MKKYISAPMDLGEISGTVMVPLGRPLAASDMAVAFRSAWMISLKERPAM
jgi:hypothetical protein